MILKVIFAFDVVSLYTNINTEEAINTALHYAVKHKLELHGLEPPHISQLLHLLLNNNVFEYPRSGFFHQIGGLAMGSKLSGTLAILVVDRFEKDHIYQNILFSPWLYVRYLDDTGTLAKNTEHAQYMLTHINSWHPMIKFDLETPDESGFLPILDTKVKIQEDGTLSTKIFTKTSNKGITLHHHSHHPTSIKRAIVRNEVRRAVRNSTLDGRSESVDAATKKLRDNGYPQD